MQNFAFIDAQNVHKGISSLGWKLDWLRFRKYLQEKYSVATAFVFVGYIPTNQQLYTKLQQAGISSSSNQSSMILLAKPREIVMLI